MNYKFDPSINNSYSILKEKDIKELNGKAFYLEHKNSKAKIFIISNNDENKVFSISFRTPAPDNCGTPHILEHSVLCGSKKYPVKEPFVELIKSSLSTFINAFTFSDKTMYPVASKNEKDFLNLIDVYMDAVLNPKIYEEKEIFLQEGWHLEYDEKKDKFFFNGVVYNEMKGAYSSPDSLLFSNIQKTLFPDNIYSNDSGGDPDYITDLTYENFLEFHKTYYHPSNSYIFIYGNADFNNILYHLDKNYLSNYSELKVDSKIEIQKPFKNEIEKTFKFPVLSEKELDNNTYFSLNFVTGLSTEPIDFMGLNILEYILMETEASPLKKALIDAEIGKDVFGTYEIFIHQPFLGIISKKSAPTKKEEFKKIVFNTLDKLVKEKIDRKLVKSAINHFEFQLREADYNRFPAGLYYNIISLSSWLYDDEPWKTLEYEYILNFIKNNYENNYFEYLISKYLLNNNHRAFVILEPESGLLEKKNKSIEQKINKIVSSLSKEQIDKILEENQKLKIRQTTPDSNENLEKLPLLKLNDIEKKPELIPLEIENNNNIQILYNNIDTKGISYIKLLFDLKSVPLEYLQYTKLFASVIGKISTKKYDYMDLSNEIDIITGGIDFSIINYIDKDNINNFSPKFSVKTKVLKENIEKSLNLINEILTNSLFNDPKRIKTIISELKSRMEISLINNGSSFALTKVSSYISESGKFNELLNGIEYYKFLKEIELNFETNKDKILNTLNSIKEILINKQNFIAGYAGNSNDFNTFKKGLNNFELKKNSIELKSWKFNTFEIFSKSIFNEAFIIPGQIQYVAKGFNYKNYGFNYNGTMSVIKLILDMDYLWNKLRVMGGAYGAYSVLSKSGFLGMTSYRDPNLKETLEAYDKAYNHLNELKLSERELRKYIIGTIGKIENVLTPSMKQDVSISRFLSNITDKDLAREKTEVLETNFNNLLSQINFLKPISEFSKYCVVGSKKVIEENKHLFSKIEIII